MAPGGKERVSTEPYKGVRDFYPEDMAVENHIFDTMRGACEQFGYQEYAASPLEPTELYAGKTSEEIVNEQTYTFEDRGGRSVTLRPEMTPTVARMVAAKSRELVFPARLYSIPNVFRYERPQRGRLREHYQLNADIFGTATLDAEIEIISLASAIMKAFGAQEEDFSIRIGSRAALSEELERRGVPFENHKAIARLLDRKGKVPELEWEAEMEKLGAPSLSIAESEDVAQVRKRLRELGVANAVFDPEIIRGFDYYTGIVFEVFDTHSENPRSLFGGGRYDNLMEMFGVDPIPAVGFGMGDVTIRDFLETHGLLPSYAPATTLYVCTTDPEKMPFAMQLASRLRASDVAVAVNLSAKKLGDQVRAADKLHIPYVLTVGSLEMESRKYKVKRLSDGKEDEVEEDMIADYLFSDIS